MTIAQAFNEIAVAQGGTASKSGSITDAIDALNDALAGSDQAPAQTIEDAVRLLGQNIGGGGGGEEYSILCYDDDTEEPISQCTYIGVYSGGHYIGSGDVVTKAKAGDVIVVAELDKDYTIAGISSDTEFSELFPPLVSGQYRTNSFTMPAHDVYVYIITES